MTTYRMVIAYDGTGFCGWQVQTSGLSIQGTIEHALATVSHEPVRIVGAGRTDAGVHARGQVAHFRLERPLPEGVLRSLNGILPKTIRILSIDCPESGFHAQRSALRKEYHYHLCFGEIVLPFEQPYVWHCRKRLDLELVRQAAAKFIGIHDFVAYANAPGREIASTIRTLFRLDCVHRDTSLCLEFEGNGFLYKMVRNITGMIVAVASGRRALSDIELVFSGKDRRLAAPAAPPQGLVLMHVKYRT